MVFKKEQGGGRGRGEGERKLWTKDLMTTLEDMLGPSARLLMKSIRNLRTEYYS